MKPIPKSHKIVFNISAGIGDALMAEPMVRTWKTCYPESQIHVIVTPSGRPVFENHKTVDKIHVLVPKALPFWKLASAIRAESPDVWIGAIPSNTYSQLLLPIVGRIPFRIKHKTPHPFHRDLDFLFDRIFTIPGGRHRVDCNLDLLRDLGLTFPNDLRPEFAVNERVARQVEGWLAEKQYEPRFPVIGLHPGCSPKAAFKRWPPLNYAGLAERMIEKYNAQIIITGGPDEVEDVKTLKAAMKNPVMDFTGAADLSETAALIRRCDFFVSNDSGIMHLATAVDVPVFALFGPKDERHVGPYGSKHTVIRNGNDVKRITVEQVIEVLKTSPFGLKR